MCVTRLPVFSRRVSAWLAGVALLSFVAADLPGEVRAARVDDWSHRPLHFPHLAPGADCPVSHVDSRVPWKRINIFGEAGIGRGPVYPGLKTAFLMANRDVQYGGPWFSYKVFWYVLPSYRGRVLIRGQRLDGQERMGFNGREVPARELRIERGQTVVWQGRPPGSRGVPSSVRVLTGGCYGVQIDGSSFSRIVVFRVDIAD